MTSRSTRPVSIGNALFPDHGPDLSTLLRKADVAMYKAKAYGDGHHVYGGADDTDFVTRLRVVEELRRALTEDELVVHYQPKIDLPTGEVHGVEALVRWDHPTRGLLYPDVFLDLVEEAGLMRAMTRVVLEVALDQAVVWRAAGRRLTIAVNLSASSLVDTELPERVATMLAARDLAPGALQLEITEEFLMADRDDPRAAALVASTISLAHSLDLRMVAEGVGNGIALSELTRLGCEQAQGYFVSRPPPPPSSTNGSAPGPLGTGALLSSSYCPPRLAARPLAKHGVDPRRRGRRRSSTKSERPLI